MQTMINFDGGAVVAIPVSDGAGKSGDADVRQFMLLEGPQGWGEFSAPRDVGDRPAVRWLTAATEPGTVGWPDPVRGRIPVAVSVPAVSSARAHQIVAASGCRTAEVAVGSSLTADITRLEAVRDALGADGRIRAVVAGCWDVDTAVSMIPELTRAAGGLEYVEQPCATVDELAAVRRQVDVRIAVDEARRQHHEPARPVAEAADIVVLTVAALGGVRRSLRVAEASGLPCVVAAGPLTSIGLAAAAALAGALPELPFACGVRRPPWLTGDVSTAGRSLVPVDGYLPVAPMPPAPDPELLARYRVTDETTLAWWRRRLQNVRRAV